MSVWTVLFWLICAWEGVVLARNEIHPRELRYWLLFVPVVLTYYLGRLD
jgi:hypothetical protein